MIQTIQPKILKPDRLRTLEKPFAWLPFRLLNEGHFASLSDHAKLLYLFLCLAADKNGISYYGDNRIRQHFQFQTLYPPRNELLKKDLIAYDGRVYQVLSLPPKTQTKQTAPPVPISRLLKFPTQCKPSCSQSQQPQPLADFLQNIQNRFC